MSVQYLDKTGLAYFWGKIKAYISSVLPTKTSDLTNDSGFINSPNIPYLTCATAANVAAKTTTLVSGTLPSTLTTGLQVLVKFTNSNTIANPTLAIGSFAAKSIKRYGTTSPSTAATTSWQTGATILFNYDGTYWQMVDWTNTNTTYSGMTDAEYQAGTSTSNRLITPARLKAAILYHAPSPTSVTVDPKVTSGTNIADITVDNTTVQLYAPSGGGVTSVNGQTGAVTLTIPSATSQLANDSDFLVASMIDDYLTPKVYAADATSQAIIASVFGGTPTIRVPNSYPSLLALLYDLNPRVMIAWMNGTELELSRIGVSVNTSNNEVTLYLRGRTSTATGIFGVDSSWTVTPNPSVVEIERW